MKMGEPKVPTIVKFLGEHAAKHYKESGSNGDRKPLRVGIDPYVHAASFKKELEESFASNAALEIDDEDEPVVGMLDTSHPNLIDPIWGEKRPAIPASPFRVHPVEYAGVSLSDKVKRIRKEMATKKATMAVFCTLDDVAYLMNMRAMGDVETCPVGIAYATITNDDVVLYCNEAKVQDEAVQEHLNEASVTIKPYEDIVPDIESHCTDKKAKVWIDKGRANLALVAVIPDKALVDSQNAITPMKACKNKAEMDGMKQAHIGRVHELAGENDCRGRQVSQRSGGRYGPDGLPCQAAGISRTELSYDCWSRPERCHHPLQCQGRYRPAEISRHVQPDPH